MATRGFAWFVMEKHVSSPDWQPARYAVEPPNATAEGAKKIFKFSPVRIKDEHMALSLSELQEIYDSSILAVPSIESQS